MRPSTPGLVKRNEAKNKKGASILTLMARITMRPERLSLDCDRHRSTGQRRTLNEKEGRSDASNNIRCGFFTEAEYMKLSMGSSLVPSKHRRSFKCPKKTASTKAKRVKKKSDERGENSQMNGVDTANKEHKNTCC